MGEILITRNLGRGPRPTQPTEKDTWDSLLSQQSFKDFSAKHLAEDTKNSLEADFAQINEDEQKDYANPHAIKRNHTREEYDKFRQEKTNQAIEHDLSRLDAKTLADLRADFAQINEDEQKDYANPHSLDHSHTKEEYDKFREDIIAKAFRKIGQKVELAATRQPDTPQVIEANDDTHSQALTAAHERAISDAHDKAIAKAEAEAIARAEAKSKQKAEVIARQQAKQAESTSSQKVEPTPRRQAEAKPSPKFTTAEELNQEIARVRAEIASKKHEIEEIKHARTLVAINADFTHDKEELARDYAEQELNAETAESNFIKRLWKGDLFKKYYWKKYEKEILEGKRQIFVNGEATNLEAIIQKRSKDAIKRFVMGVMDDPETSHFVHRDIGDQDGERLTAADEETTSRIKHLIRKSIESGLQAGLVDKDFTDKFKEGFKRYEAEARDKKESPSLIHSLNNYAEVATVAYELARQHQSIDTIMEGFKVYNAEVRSNQRTKAHRDNLDKLIDKIESSSVGQIVPAEVIAGAVGSVYSLTKVGTRAVVGLGAGLGLSGAFAGLRERNRITEDRTRMMRDAAEGLTHDSASLATELTGLQKLNARQRAKYEVKLGGTLYEIKPATYLIDNISSAIESKDRDAIMHAIAEARVRIDYSDSEQKDLIAYSSADQMGRERLELDSLVIGAEKIIEEAGFQDRLDTIKQAIQRSIDEEVKSTDKDFNKLRTLQSLKRAGKTIALGAAFALTAQEIVAAISPSKIGIFEKVGLLRTKNRGDATETMLANLTGPRTYTDEITGIIEGTEGQYSQAGFDITKTADGYTESLPPTTSEVSIGDVPGIKANIRWADNSTAYSEGNEFGLRIDEVQGNFYTNVAGTSSLPSGETVDVTGNVAGGNARLLLNIGGKTLESDAVIINPATGQAVFGQNGYIVTTTGDIVQVLGGNGERLFDSAQLVIKDGVGPDATQYFTSIATAKGSGAIGSITRTVQNSIYHPAVYTATRTFRLQSEVFGSGVISPITARTGLGDTTRNEQ